MKVEKSEFCVVIPVHHKDLDTHEKKSLVTCFSILGSYPIYLLKPQNLDGSKYLEIAPDLIIQNVPDNWMASWKAYNLMKRSIEFYRLFAQHKFMLTYELDCLIFSDEWESCNVFEYDFIGAPWFENSEIENSTQIPKMKQGMNSGFSIRNVQTCIKVLETINSAKMIWKVYKLLHLHSLVKLAGILKHFNPLWKTGPNVYFFELMNPNPIHEDYFWTVIVPKLFKFKLAPNVDSIKFSFEEHPSHLYKINGEKLPLGCHAWQKFEVEFWRGILNYNGEK